MKSKIEKILFITEKWCDGDPRMGLTNNFHNLFGTLSHAYPKITIGLLHLDEVVYSGLGHVDNVIPSAIDQFNPDVIVVSHLGSDIKNPTNKSYQLISNKGIPICFIWPDTRDWVLNAFSDLDSYASSHVSFGGEQSEPINEKHLLLWAPQDPKLYFNDKKTNLISFVGSLNGNYTYRREYVNYVSNSGIPIVVSGGQREKKLSAEDYAKLIRTSCMSINFPESAKPGTDQIKGRVLEITSCQTLLMEKKNDITPRYFKPGIHYVEYEDKVDLVDKIRYYEKNVQERELIAAQGKRHYEENYNPEKFWGAIFTKLGLQP